MGIEALIPALMKGGADVLKAFLGTDKVEKVEVKDDPQDKRVVPADDVLLGELGLRRGKDRPAG